MIYTEAVSQNVKIQEIIGKWHSVTHLQYIRRIKYHKLSLKLKVKLINNKCTYYT